MRIKSHILKAIPFITSATVGVLLFYLSSEFNDSLKELILNLSASFIAIPLIYLFYRLAKNFSERKLNKEIFDYSKMLIDTEVLSLINQLGKFIYPMYTFSMTKESVNNLCKIKKKGLIDILSEGQYLGFQIKKNWDVAINNIQEKIINNNIINKLDNERLSVIIELLKVLISFRNILKPYSYFENKGTIINKYKIIPPSAIRSPENQNLPDRYILLTKIDDDKGVVTDFGDFRKYQSENLLALHKFKPDYLQPICEEIFQIMATINKWLSLTDYEFILDFDMFRMGINKGN
jgi:hypothetical protein